MSQSLWASFDRCTPFIEGVRVSMDGLRPEGALNLLFDLDDQVLPHDRDPMPNELRDLGRDFGHAVRTKLPLDAGTYSFVPWGTVDVAHFEGPSCVDLGCAVIAHDPAHEARRLLSWLREAGAQISSTGLPGIAVIDVDNTGQSPAHGYPAVVAALEHEKAMRDIAAVLFRYRWHCQADLLPTSVVRFLPGPRAGDCPTQLGTVLRECSQAHWHYEPLRPGGAQLACDREDAPRYGSPI